MATSHAPAHPGPTPSRTQQFWEFERQRNQAAQNGRSDDKKRRKRRFIKKFFGPTHVFNALTAALTGGNRAG